MDNLKVPTEAEEQKAFVQYLKAIGEDRFFFIQNEQPIVSHKRNRFAYLNKIKGMGFKSGMPDMQFLFPKYLTSTTIDYLGLFIEMKSTAKSAKVSTNQKRMNLYLTELGYKVVTAYGCAEAIKGYESYINKS